jgi:hypothetical protein
MTVVMARDQVSWERDRIADAKYAAETGDGWGALSQRWGTSRPGALQWCQLHCPPDVVAKIGQNGRRSRQPNKGRQYHHSKPRLVVTPLQPIRQNDVCRKLTYRAGQAVECGEPTDGHTYCPSCSRHLITLTDRAQTAA